MDAAEKLARRFHEAYERLAPQHGYETRAETRAFDPSTPNGRLMISVCRELVEPEPIVPQWCPYCHQPHGVQTVLPVGVAVPVQSRRAGIGEGNP